MSARAVDPITFAVVKSALDTIVDDMAYTVMRTARSPIVRDVLDYSCTLCDADGQICLQRISRYEGLVYQRDSESL